MPSGRSKLRVMLVDNNADCQTVLVQALRAGGHTVVARVGAHADLMAAVSLYQPEIVVIDVDAPATDTLKSMGQLDREQPRPSVLFTTRSDAETTRRAVQAGVSAYIVDGFYPERLSALLEVAIARFELHQTLRRELNDARGRLADQRDIEKAKGVLMKRRKLDEAAAYDLLRRMAMDRQQRIGEFARALLAAADVL